MAHWTVYAAELIGIFYAISPVYKIACQNQGYSVTDQPKISNDPM